MMRTPPALLSALLCLAATAPAAARVAFDYAESGATRTVMLASSARATAQELAALRAAEQRRAQAVANRDIATLRQLISGNYYHVESTGRARTKTEFLQLLARDAYEFRSYEVGDMEATMIDNGRAALVTGRFKAAMQGPNRSGELRGRYVRMWMLGPDGWRNTMQQTTEIRAPAPQREAVAQH